jgi:DNA-binding LytR/AlgR family response regulator
MINILIIEDEQPAAKRLEKMLVEAASDFKVIQHCDSIETSVEYLQTHSAPDLILLDIQLGDGLCFEIFNQVEVDSPIIFTTAYDEYAIKAFELNSIDYLLKPINREKLEQSIVRFRKRLSVVDPQLLVSLFNKDKRAYKQRFLVSTATSLISVLTTEVAYFYSVEGSSFMITKQGKSYSVEYSLDKLEEMVSPEEFFRINRQYLVSLASIKKISIHSKSRIKLILEPASADEVVVSNARSHTFRRWLDHF